jgi:hypothetical protein
MQMQIQKIMIILGVAAAALHVLTEGESTLYWARQLKAVGR